MHDELTALARDSGAIGSKIMGGSYCISMVRKADVDAFLDKMGEQYYAKRRP